MKSASRTPYEIRLELLQLAFNILSEKSRADASVEGPGQPPKIVAPTTEEVIAEADKLNGFVSKASN